MYRSIFVESLESRRLLSAVYPTAVETYLVELINRARANPTAEASRYSISLNEGLAADTISAVAKQPVAINPYITDAAVKHSQWMIDTDVFSHDGANGSDPGDRISAAGYNFTAPSGWGENLAWSGTTGSPPDPGVAVPELHKNLFVDADIPDRGHRINMLDPDFREVGPGVLNGVFQGYNAVMLTTDFAYTKDTYFITGVAYDDLTIDNDFYTPGEGLGGVTILAVRDGDSAEYSTQTWESGAYSLKVPAGTYTVTATGGPLGSAVMQRGTVTIANRNVKVDVVPGGDVAGPVATLAKPSNVASAGVSPLTFTVTYNDATGVDISTLDSMDLTIIGPDSTAYGTTLVDHVESANGKTVTARYRMNPPGGGWDVEDNGTFTVMQRANQVKDTANNVAPTKLMGTFTVAIPLATRKFVSGADFNNDGKEDIAWYDASGGKQGIWYMDGATRLSKANLPDSPNRVLVGVGDFDGDGTSEFLWRGTGDLKIATLAEAQLGAGALRSINAVVPSAVWVVAGVGDFDGNGTDDLLWYNGNTGATNLWIMSNGQRQQALPGQTVANRAWKPVSAGDLNNDGKDDVIWRNSVTGGDLAWIMNRTVVRQVVQLRTTANLAWRLDSSGDLNNDGTSDLLWRNVNTGAAVAWLMNGTTVAASVSLPSV